MRTDVLNPIYCADAIALHESTGLIVVVERLAGVKGLALPGGKQDAGETLSATVKREVFEETGLVFTEAQVLGTYGNACRDPRGKYISTVFVGTTKGVPVDEPGKTKVVLYDLRTFAATRHLFVFDHATMLADYLKLRA